ncbi:MAG: XRE family transcriptional regulator [Pirellulaceae bacterium]|nr:XRE family transcriptional regulator [Pirellulaceae bacterium]
MTIGTRLKWAREAAGLTQRQLSVETEIGVSTISEFESDTRGPSALQMVQLAAALQRSVDFFHQPGAPTAEVVLWRQRPTDAPVERIQVQLLQLAEQFHRLEQLCGNPEPPQLEFASGDATTFSLRKAEGLAHEFRNRYALGERPGQVLLRVLEDVIGVKVFFLDFEPSGTAACTLSDKFGPAILLNGKNVSWRRNFDLAHELFHLLTWKVFRSHSSLGTEVSTPREERLADCFAGHLLVPDDALRAAITRQQREKTTLDFDDLFDVARQFAVSVPALVFRCQEEGIIHRDAADRLLTQILGRNHFWEKRKNFPPPKRPFRFEALAFEAIGKGLIGTGKFADFMGISRHQAMKLLEEKEDEFGQEGNIVEVEIADS